MMGAGAHGLVLVRMAVEQLQRALVGIPMGSELHTAVLKAVSDISRRMENSPPDHAAQMQQMNAQAHDQQNNPQADALKRIMSGAGQPPGGAPMPPSPGQ